MITPATHPAGSRAVFAGESGTIHQWFRDGVRAKFFGQRAVRTVEARELEPDPLDLTPFEAWCAARIVQVGGSALTPAPRAHQDYLDFCVARGFTDRLTPRAFSFRMRDAGYLATVARRADAFSRATWCRHWKIALAPGAPR